MNLQDQYLLAALIVKSAATAPTQPGGMGSSFMPGQQPMASMMNGFQNAVDKSPLEAASMNVGGAGGGMQAMLAARSGMPQASMISNWMKQLNLNKGHALY